METAQPIVIETPYGELKFPGAYEQYLRIESEDYPNAYRVTFFVTFLMKNRNCFLLLLMKIWT